MSFPNIPSITPSIGVSRDQAITLLLASIALEELSLAHLVNSEAEKVQAILGTLEDGIEGALAKSLPELLEGNRSANRILGTITKKEMLLQSKLEDVLQRIPSIRCITEIRGPDGSLWFTVEFKGVSNRTWTYVVTNVNAPHDLSHWSLRIPCITRENIIAWQPADAEIDTTENDTCPPGDPFCGPPGANFGIKFEFPVEVGESATFSFTLNVDLPLGTTCFLLKFATETRCGLICGPQCP